MKHTLDKMYKANFPWPHIPGSCMEAGYEFANASTEEYQEQWWNTLQERFAYCHGVARYNLTNVADANTPKSKCEYANDGERITHMNDRTSQDEALQNECEELREENARLREALTRLASSQAFGSPRAIDKVKDEELILRMEFASQALSTPEVKR